MDINGFAKLVNIFRSFFYDFTEIKTIVFVVGFQICQCSKSSLRLVSGMISLAVYAQGFINLENLEDLVKTMIMPIVKMPGLSTIVLFGFCWFPSLPMLKINVDVTSQRIGDH